MARAAGGGCRKEAAGWEGDEGQCDSGIESLRSLPGGRDAPAGVEPPVPAEEPPEEKRPGEEPPAEERLDSSYGSGALPEALPRLPAACGTEEPPPADEGLSRRQLEALNFVSEDGDTLVHLAIIHCAPDVAFFCITHLPREMLETQNDLFQTPLHLACEQQYLYCAQQLLQGTAEPPEHHQDLQLQNWQGLACLHISTLKGNIEMMSLLLQRGANIDVQEGTSGKTPLHLAVECCNRRVVQFLLHNGAYVDAQMYNGCTPLHLAVCHRDAAIAAILSHSGADTLLKNLENETAQDLADGNNDLLALLPFDDLKISGKPVVCSE
ncbi:NF-kappa-B inhibitor epsilon isoform 2-T2 [Mergus octosetaceus]